MSDSTIKDDPSKSPENMTIAFSHMEVLLQSKEIDKSMVKSLMNLSDEKIDQYKQEEPPKVKVTLYRVSLDDGKETKERMSNSYFPLPIQEAYLWDLSKFDKLDILRFGRFQYNELRPSLNNNNDEMDLKVSRQHSIIGLNGNQVYYIDYGTSQKYKSQKENSIQSHIGSKNGSWIYEQHSIKHCIKNECVPWSSDKQIGTGSFFRNISFRGQHMKLIHKFLISHELLA